MGSGTYSAATYMAGAGARVAAGTNFTYDRTVRSTGNYKAHELVDPKKKNKAGKNVREAFDSADHPVTLPVVAAFDSTGSMAGTPRTVQKKLTNLFGLLVRKGYTGDAYPQLAISTYGDAFCDRVPLQISQFEANNAVDDALDALYLEGGGGGNGGETATLLWYYLANHVDTDAYNKRGKKGYFFMIADEIALGLEPDQIERFIGVSGETPARETLTAKALADKLQEKWEVYVLLVDNSTAHWQKSQEFYTNLFGKNNVIIVENDETVVETIGAVIGKRENDDLDDTELLDDLVAEGADKSIAAKTLKAVAHIGGGGGAVNIATSNLEDLGEEDTSVKL